MPPPLRRLAVLVDEPTNGAYRWVLIEAAGEYIESWIEVAKSEEVYAKYHAAMAAGLRALQAQIEDLDLGPREAIPEPAKPSRHGGMFGIGLGTTIRR